MWWQDNWQGHFGTTQDGGTSRHLFLLTRVMKQCGTRPKSGSPFHIVSSLSLYDTRRKAIIMTGSACWRVLPEDDVHKEWVTIYPPGRHWLDLDIQHSWHQKNSATSKNVSRAFFQPCLVSSVRLFPGLVVWAEGVFGHRQTEWL